MGITLKHVTGITFVVNRTGTSKLWGIENKNAKRGDFLLITRKHVSGFIRRANPRETPKLWTITHENDHKHQNDKFLAMPSSMYLV